MSAVLAPLPSLDILLRRIRFNELHRKLIGVFLVGSRLWRTTTSYNADVDIIVIVDGTLAKRSTTSRAAVSIDASIMGIEEFSESLYDHDFISLICLSLAKTSHKCCLYQDKVMPTICVIDKFRLSRSLAERSSKDAEKAAKFFQKQHFTSGQKIMCHALRNKLFALQLLRDGCISEFEVGRELFHEVLFEAVPSTVDDCDTLLAPAIKVAETTLQEELRHSSCKSL